MKEKTADIDILEEMLKNTKTNRRGNKEIKFEVNSNYYTAISNLIAENKELKVNNKKLQDKCKELIFEKQELTSALLDSTPNDKIKAKIEEINKEMLNEENSLELFYRKKYCKEALQSLLGKE